MPTVGAVLLLLLLLLSMAATMSWMVAVPVVVAVPALLVLPSTPGGGTSIRFLGTHSGAMLGAPPPGRAAMTTSFVGTSRGELIGGVDGSHLGAPFVTSGAVVPAAGVDAMPPHVTALLFAAAAAAAAATAAEKSFTAGVSPFSSALPVGFGADTAAVAAITMAAVASRIASTLLDVTAGLCCSMAANRDRRFDTPLMRRKCFCAWLATCVGVRVGTKYLLTARQLPFPSLSSPSRNCRCSCSVHGTPLCLVAETSARL